MPDQVVGVADSERELGGYFSGEYELKTIKSSFYTVKEIPADVEPQDLVRILATAVKEKNWNLYLDAIAPNRRKTEKAIARLRPWNHLT